MKNMQYLLYILSIILISCSSVEKSSNFQKELRISLTASPQIENKQVLTNLTFSAEEKKTIVKWSNQDLQAANTAGNSTNLTAKEKKVIFYMNLARINGPLFANTILKNYVQKSNKDYGKWLVSLKNDLQKTSGFTPLQPRQDLFSAAKNHAKDMGETGLIGHKSSNGKSYKERMKKYQRSYRRLAENCFYGKDNAALRIVVELLIDKGIAGTLHRKNILQPKLQYTATSIQDHEKYASNCVIVFGRSAVR